MQRSSTRNRWSAPLNLDKRKIDTSLKVSTNNKALVEGMSSTYPKVVEKIWKKAARGHEGEEVLEVGAICQAYLEILEGEADGENKQTLRYLFFALANAPEVTKSQLNLVTTMFAPFERSVEKIAAVLAAGWFHGSISRELAEALLLKNAREGLFLVRFSTTRVGTFAIDYILKGQIQHLSCWPDATGSLVIPVESNGSKQKTFHYDTLNALIADNAKIFKEPLENQAHSHRRRSRSADSEHELCPPSAREEKKKRNRSATTLRSPTSKKSKKKEKKSSSRDDAKIEINYFQLPDASPWARVSESEFDLSKAIVMGRGTYGTVYKTEWRGRPVAVKKLFSTSGKEFDDEVRAMSSTKSPYLVELLGLNRDAQLIVTEYMEGGNLNEFLRKAAESKKGKLHMKTIKRLALNVANGMQHMHIDGFVHRDLKPDNILLTKSKGKWIAKIGDFGLARKMAPNMTAAKGTFAYMAPELLCHNDEKQSMEYDEKVDIYSFGFLLFDMIYLNNPFANMGPRVVHEIVEGRRPAIPNSPAVPEKVRALIQSCWAATPSERPSATAVLNVMNQWKKKKSSLMTSLSGRNLRHNTVSKKKGN